MCIDYHTSLNLKVIISIPSLFQAEYINSKIQILAGNTLRSRFHVGFEIELPLVTIESYMSHRCYTAFKYAFLRSYIHADFR